SALELALALAILLIAIGRIQGACRSGEGQSVVVLQQAEDAKAAAHISDVAPLVLLALPSVDELIEVLQALGLDHRVGCHSKVDAADREDAAKMLNPLSHASLLLRF